MPARVALDYGINLHHADALLVLWQVRLSRGEESVSGHTPYRRLLRTTRLLTDARMSLDMLAHRLRDGGPEMSREQMLERVQFAAGKINEVVPRSPLRDENETKS